MSRRAFIAGVGMTPFRKPGSHDQDYPDLAREAGAMALQDAGIPYSRVQQVIAGFVFGDSTCGQRAAYELGLTGIPIYNVNNNCATGSSALLLAKQLVEGGAADVVLALGFEKMEKGPLGGAGGGRTNPVARHYEAMARLHPLVKAPPTAQLFANAGAEHMATYGSTPRQFAAVAAKNHRHSVNNPRSQFRDGHDVEAVLASRPIYGLLTKLQCCPTSDGAAAAIVCSEAALERLPNPERAVELAAMAMVTDLPSSFETDTIRIVGADMSREAAKQAYEQAQLGPEHVQVMEVHDCFSVSEVLTYEALGLCGEGEGGVLAESGDTTYGGRWVVNPSGGLIAKGHPLGATGLAQCAELCWQLRGEAGDRQVAGARVALQHNLGLGGAAVVGIYRRV